MGFFVVALLPSVLFLHCNLLLSQGTFYECATSDLTVEEADMITHPKSLDEMSNMEQSWLLAPGCGIASSLDAKRCFDVETIAYDGDEAHRNDHKLSLGLLCTSHTDTSHDQGGHSV